MSKVIFQIWLEASVPKDTLQMMSGKEYEALLGGGSLPFTTELEE